MIRRVQRFLGRLSLRDKLVAVVTLPMITTIVLVLAISALSEIHRTKASIQENTRSILVALSQDFKRLVLREDQRMAADVTDRCRSCANFEQLYVYDAEGQPIFSYRKPGVAETAPPTPGDRPWSEFTGDRLRMLLPLESDTRRIGSAFVQVNTAEIKGKIGQHFWTASCASAGIALVGVLVAFLLQRLIAAPIFELGRTAKRVSEKMDFSIRATKHADDELGQVTDAFNCMLERIQTDESSLRNEPLDTAAPTCSANPSRSGLFHRSIVSNTGAV